MSNPIKPIKTILCTGGCGYIGSQLIRDLMFDKRFPNVTVRILDNMQAGYYHSLMDLPSTGRYQFIEGDILDSASLRLALQGADAVIHLAAVVRTPISFDNPAWVKQVNHWGTSRVVEACIDAGVTRLIYASSAAVYGPGEEFTENDICRPIGPYANSKYQGEKAVMAAMERGLVPTILRLGTVFGLAPVLRFDAVFNRFLYLAGVDRFLTIYGSGDQIRPFVHVRDASEAFRFCLERLEQTRGEILNVVGENISILGIARLIQEIKPSAIVHFTEQDILTHLSFQVKPDKLLSMGWKSQITGRQGAKELLTHFRALARVGDQRNDYLEG